MTNQPSGLDRRSFVKTLALGAGASLAAPGLLRAQTATLTLSSWLPRNGLIYENMMAPLIEEITAATGGALQVETLEKPLGPPPAHLDLLRGGQTDLAYSLHGYTQGEFERAKIGQFSFLGDAYSVSNAFSRVYGELLQAETEHPGMKLLGLFQHGPGVLMLKGKRIDTPADFKGLKIRTSGGYIAELVTNFGAENVPMSPTDVRQALIDGAIDGVMFPYEGALAFNLMDQITYVSELSGGYYNATWFMGMSEAAVQRIGPDLAEAVAQKSRETVHLLAAKAFDYADYVVKQDMIKAGVEIAPVTEEVAAFVKTYADQFEADWAGRLQAEGFDGQKALTFTRRITQGG